MSAVYCPCCHKRIIPNETFNAYMEKQESYPYNLYRVVLGKPVKNITPEMEKGLDYALATLSGLEQKVLQYCFKLKKDIAYEWKADGKVWPTLLLKRRALYKLHQPEMLKYLLAGCPDVINDDFYDKEASFYEGRTHVTGISIRA